MELELRAERMAAGGDAIARDPSGRIVFITGALPGELVRVTTTAEKRDYAKSVVTDIVEPSPHRVAPPCPNVARGCGGCAWQHITPAAQHEMKRDIVVDALRRTARLPDAQVVLGPAAPIGAVPHISPSRRRRRRPPRISRPAQSRRRHRG